MSPKCNDRSDPWREDLTSWLDPIPPYRLAETDDGTVALIEYAYHSVIQRVARAIEDGELKPGQRLPRQRDMANAFGMSLATVAKAVNTLKAAAVLVSEPGRGVFVTEDAVRLETPEEWTADPEHNGPRS